MRVAIYIDDPRVRERFLSGLDRETWDPVDAPGAEAQLSSVWVVDHSDGPDASRRLWSREIPSHAWVLAIVQPGGEEEALNEGADDVLVYPFEPLAQERRLCVAQHQEERTAPLWRRRSLADRLPGLVMQLDTTGGIAWVNHQFERTLGLSARDVTGRQPCDLVCDSDASVAKLLVADFAVNNPQRCLDLRMRAHDGRVVLVSWRLTFDLDGDTLLAFGADHSAVFESDRRSLVWRAAWSSSVQRAGWPSLIVGPDDRIVSVSGSAESLWAASEADMVGRPVAEWLHSDIPHPWRQSEAEARMLRGAVPVRTWSWNVGPTDPAGQTARVIVAMLADAPVLRAGTSAPDPTYAPDPMYAPPVALPEPPAARARAPEGPELGVMPGAPLVFVVDANEGLRAFVQRVARSNGFRTLMATGTTQASTFVHEVGDDVAVAFIDLSESEASVDRLLIQLGSRPHSPRIYMMTASPVDGAETQRWRDKGATEVVTKPLSLQLLKQTLQRIQTPAG